MICLSFCLLLGSKSILEGRSGQCISMFIISIQILKIYFIEYALTVVPIFLPVPPSTWYPPFHPSMPHLNSCPWVVHISYLASPFPILFLTSPCLFCTYHLCFLIPEPFLPFSLFPLPTDNLPCDLHFCDSVPILDFCLACFFRFSC